MRLVCLILIVLNVTCLSFSFHVGVVHDETFNLTSPRFHTAKWISAVFKALQELHNSHAFSYLFISTDTIIQQRIASSHNFTSFDSIITCSHCEATDLVVSQLAQLGVKVPVIRIDFSPCLEYPYRTERLELFRLPIEKRYTCLSTALEHYLMASRVPKGGSYKLNPTQELWKCSNISTPKWNSEVYSTDVRVPLHIAEKYIRSKAFRFGTIVERPFVAQDENKIYRGLVFEVVRVLQEKYNFSYSTIKPLDNKYGKDLPNGTWNGLIGMIINKEIDVATASLSLTYSRSKVVDMTNYFHEEPTTVLIPPPQEEDRLLACTKPFQLQVWIGLVVIIVFLPMFLWLHRWIVWRMTRFSDSAPKLVQQYFFVYGLLVTQSGQSTPKLGTAPRLLAATWCLSSVIFVYVYVSTLMTFLTVPKLRPVINFVEELPNTNLIWNVPRGAALDALFTEAKDGPYRLIGEGLLKNPKQYVDRHLDGFYRVVNNSRNVFIREKSGLESTMEQDFKETGQCRVSLAKAEFFKTWQTFAMPKGSIYLELFNREMTQMIESGLSDYWHRKHWPRPNKCKELSKGKPAASMSLKDLQSAFVILTMGSAASILTYLLEWFHFVLYPKN